MTAFDCLPHFSFAQQTANETMNSPPNDAVMTEADTAAVPQTAHEGTKALSPQCCLEVRALHNPTVNLLHKTFEIIGKHKDWAARMPGMRMAQATAVQHRVSHTALLALNLLPEPQRGYAAKAIEYWEAALSFCVDFDWLLNSDAVRLALTQLTAGYTPTDAETQAEANGGPKMTRKAVKHNTASEYNGTIGMLCWLHPDFTTNATIRDLYAHCETEKLRFIALNRAENEQKKQDQKDGKLTNKMKNFSALMSTVRPAGSDGEGQANIVFAFNNGSRSEQLLFLLTVLFTSEDDDTEQADGAGGGGAAVAGALAAADPESVRRGEARFTQVYIRRAGEDGEYAYYDAATKQPVDKKDLPNDLAVLYRGGDGSITGEVTYHTVKALNAGAKKQKAGETFTMSRMLCQLLAEEMSERFHSLKPNQASNYAITNQGGKSIHNPGQEKEVGRIFNRFFKCVKGAVQEGEQAKDHNVSSTELRKYFASKKAKAVWAAEETIIAAKKQLSHHGGEDLLGVHASYLHALPQE
jgi:hypothetical protein